VDESSGTCQPSSATGVVSQIITTNSGVLSTVSTMTTPYTPQSCHGKKEATVCGSAISHSDCDDSGEHGDFAKTHCPLMCGLECTSFTTATAITTTTDIPSDGQNSNENAIVVSNASTEEGGSGDRKSTDVVTAVVDDSSENELASIINRTISNSSRPLSANGALPLVVTLACIPVILLLLACVSCYNRRRKQDTMVLQELRKMRETTRSNPNFSKNTEKGHTRPVDPTMKAVNFPWHWEHPLTDEMRLIPLRLSSKEACAITNRLVQEFKPSGKKVDVVGVSRCQNKRLFVQYDQERTKVAINRGDCNERWLWHGTDALDSIITNGFNAFTYGSLSFNAYGLGNYFAPDAKLSDYFIREARGGFDGEKKLILARVCCGRIADKTNLVQSLRWGLCKCADRSNHNASCEWDREMRKLLANPENRGAPDGFDSVTGAGKHFESVIFKDTMAYSSYVITYKLPDGSLPDPYHAKDGYLKTMDATSGWSLPRGK
jgi:hypothetical protein